jgi:hypothetical protein
MKIKVYSVVFDRRAFRAYFGQTMPKVATRAVVTLAVDTAQRNTTTRNAWKSDITVYPISRKKPQRFEDFEASFRDGGSVLLPKYRFWQQFDRVLTEDNCEAVADYTKGVTTYDEMIMRLLETGFEIDNEVNPAPENEDKNGN